MVMQEAQGSEWVPVRTLGVGGMGSVELVVKRGDHFARPFVRKRCHQLDEHARKRLRDEGRLGGLVDAPQIVPVVDVGEDPSGPYLILEYVDGASLVEVMQECIRTGTLLGAEVVAYIGEQIALALSALHALTDTSGEPLGVVHRDVSPHNVMIGLDGRVRLTDLGIARAEGRLGETLDGSVSGKLGYLAPEQLARGSVDASADIYALGVLLVEALTLERLFLSHERPRALELDFYDYRRDVSPAFEGLLFEMLAHDPAERPSSGAGVAARLLPIVGDVRLAERELAGLMTDCFAERRDEIRQELSRALDENTRAGPSSFNATSERQSTRPSWRLLTLGVLAALGTVAIVGGIWAWMVHRPVALEGSSRNSANAASESSSPNTPEDALSKKKATSAPAGGGDMTGLSPDTSKLSKSAKRGKKTPRGDRRKGRIKKRRREERRDGKKKTAESPEPWEWPGANEN